MDETISSRDHFSLTSFILQQFLHFIPSVCPFLHVYGNKNPLATTTAFAIINVSSVPAAKLKVASTMTMEKSF